MKKYRQSVFSNVYGDCFRACMATVLQLPPQVLPNDHSPLWYHNWDRYLNQFGLTLWHNSAQGPIWSDGYWIASVKSLNFKKGTHAIVMHETHKVFHDPSTKKRYKTGAILSGLGKDAPVVGGYRLEVYDSTQIHRLQEYRDKLNERLGTT